MLRICSIFDLRNKSLNLSYKSNFLLDWFSGSSDASLPLNLWKRIAPINLISSIKSITTILKSIIIDYSQRIPLSILLISDTIN